MTKTEAIEGGYKRYTGEPCDTCTGTIRYVLHDKCVACMARSNFALNERTNAQKRRLTKIISSGRNQSNRSMQ